MNTPADLKRAAEAIDLAADLGGKIDGEHIVLTIEQARTLVEIPSGIADWGRTRCRRALAQQAARARNHSQARKNAEARAKRAEERAKEATKHERVLEVAREQERVIQRAVQSLEAAAQQASDAVEKVRSLQQS